jgi:transposase InsO family protein
VVDRTAGQRARQYTSAQLAAIAGDLGLAQSVGRTGVCWDIGKPRW